VLNREIIAVIGLASLITTGQVLADDVPDKSLDLRLTATIDTWDEAIPLGNGLIGGLLWGRDQTIRLSLDRGDLWDTRLQDEFTRSDCTWRTIQRLVAEKNQTELVRRFDAPYDRAWPTKLPGGRLELTLDPSHWISSFSLGLSHAVGQAILSNDLRLDAFISATAPVAMIRIPGAAPSGWKLIAPSVVKQLGYPAAELGVDGDTKWFVQSSATTFRYAVVASACRDGDCTLLAVAITTSDDGADPVRLGRDRVTKAIHEMLLQSWGGSDPGLRRNSLSLAPGSL
jgi:alpha-L-fucosidase 2